MAGDPDVPCAAGIAEWILYVAEAYARGAGDGESKAGDGNKGYIPEDGTDVRESSDHESVASSRNDVQRKPGGAPDAIAQNTGKTHAGISQYDAKKQKPSGSAEPAAATIYGGTSQPDLVGGYYLYPDADGVGLPSGAAGSLQSAHRWLGYGPSHDGRLDDSGFENGSQTSFPGAGNHAPFGPG